MEDLLQEEFKKLFVRLSNKDFPGASGREGIIAAIQVKSTRDIGEKLKRLAEVMDTDSLCKSLDSFRQSMDRGNDRTWWLTLCLVICTALLVIVGAVNLVFLTPLYWKVFPLPSTQTSVESQSTPGPPSVSQ